MEIIAILISGHLRNLNEIINNFKENLLDPISIKYKYDIYIHTWDTNYTKDNVMNNDKYYNEEQINIKYINNIFQKENINIKKIIIENQKNIYDLLNIDLYLDLNCKDKSIHGNFLTDYVKDLTNKLFWQFYGHYKLLENIDNIDNYDYIIKTRPDMFYDKFDNTLFNNNIFFPFSHQMRATNINQLFFGGKTKYMIEILKFFQTFIYFNKNINFHLIKNHKTDINFNRLFRYYILDYLLYKPFFSQYNPKIYRSKKNIITIK